MTICLPIYMRLTKSITSNSTADCYRSNLRVSSNSAVVYCSNFGVSSNSAVDVIANTNTNRGRVDKRQRIPAQEGQQDKAYVMANV